MINRSPIRALRKVCKGNKHSKSVNMIVCNHSDWLLADPDANALTIITNQAIVFYDSFAVCMVSYSN